MIKRWSKFGNTSNISKIVIKAYTKKVSDKIDLYIKINRMEYMISEMKENYRFVRIHILSNCNNCIMNYYASCVLKMPFSINSLHLDMEVAIRPISYIANLYNTLSI